MSCRKASTTRNTDETRVTTTIAIELGESAFGDVRGERQAVRPRGRPGGREGPPQGWRKA